MWKWEYVGVYVCVCANDKEIKNKLMANLLPILMYYIPNCMAQRYQKLIYFIIHISYIHLASQTKKKYSVYLIEEN